MRVHHLLLKFWNLYHSYCSLPHIFLWKMLQDLRFVSFQSTLHSTTYILLSLSGYLLLYFSKMVILEYVILFPLLQTSDTHEILVEILEKNNFVTQEFILSPLQFGLPYSRPRYYCLVCLYVFLFGFYLIWTSIHCHHMYVLIHFACSGLVSFFQRVVHL